MKDSDFLNDFKSFALEYNLKIWDLAAVEILIKEVGGDFIRIGEQTLESGLKLYGAIFGKKEAVAEVHSLLFRELRFSYNVLVVRQG